MGRVTWRASAERAVAASRATVEATGCRVSRPRTDRPSPACRPGSGRRWRGWIVIGTRLRASPRGVKRPRPSPRNTPRYAVSNPRRTTLCDSVRIEISDREAERPARRLSAKSCAIREHRAESLSGAAPSSRYRPCRRGRNRPATATSGTLEQASRPSNHVHSEGVGSAVERRGAGEAVVAVWRFVRRREIAPDHRRRNPQPRRHGCRRPGPVLGCRQKSHPGVRGISDQHLTVADADRRCQSGAARRH